MRNISRGVAAAAQALLVSACGGDDPAGVAALGQAEHSWNGYHWPSDHLGPGVLDKTGSASWQVAARVQDWSALGQPIQPAMSSTTKGDITVGQQYSAIYLGLAQIWADGTTGHITRGKVTLNPVLLSSPYTADGAAHVTCQEVGHVLGLDHQQVGTSCMDDCQYPDISYDDWLACINDPSRAGPNAHDSQELGVIYNHTDGSGSGSGAGGGPPCDKNPSHPNCIGVGEWITVHVFERRRPSR